MLDRSATADVRQSGSLQLGEQKINDRLLTAAGTRQSQQLHKQVDCAGIAACDLVSGIVRRQRPVCRVTYLEVIRCGIVVPGRAGGIDELPASLRIMSRNPQSLPRFTPRAVFPQPFWVAKLAALTFSTQARAVGVPIFSKRKPLRRGAPAHRSSAGHALQGRMDFDRSEHGSRARDGHALETPATEVALLGRLGLPVRDYPRRPLVVAASTSRAGQPRTSAVARRRRRLSQAASTEEPMPGLPPLAGPSPEPSLAGRWSLPTTTWPSTSRLRCSTNPLRTEPAATAAYPTSRRQSPEGLSRRPPAAASWFAMFAAPGRTAARTMFSVESLVKVRDAVFAAVSRAGSNNCEQAARQRPLRRSAAQPATGHRRA